MARIVTVTTDFGYKDPYVGALKGALLSVNPEAVIIDISNGVEPGNIKEAAFTLCGAYACYPAGTIHLCVVDPGVGSARRALIVETQRYMFVGPDNGLLSLALGNETVLQRVSVIEQRYFNTPVSPTFHGRDLFAPVAGHLSLGERPEAFGPAVDTCVALPVPSPLFSNQVLTGSVIHIDCFGNIITSIKEEDLLRCFKGVERFCPVVAVGTARITGLCRTYSDVGAGEGVALIGSSGYLEVALNSGNAATCFGVEAGAGVAVTARRGV